MGLQNNTAIEGLSLAEQTRRAAAAELVRAGIDARAAGVAVLQVTKDRADVFVVWDERDDSRLSQSYSTKDVEFLRAAKSTGTILSDADVRNFSQILFPLLKSFQRISSSPLGTPAVIFGFASQEPPNDPIPPTAIERINGAGLAVWAAQEVARLRSELKSVANRLAARKAVERAKRVLQADRAMSDQAAEEYLRLLSRQRRTPLAEIAQEINRRIPPPGNVGESEYGQLTEMESSK